MQASPSADVEITPGPDDEWERHTANFTYASGEGWTARGVPLRRVPTVFEVDISAVPLTGKPLPSRQPLPDDLLLAVADGYLMETPPVGRAARSSGSRRTWASRRRRSPAG